MRRDAGILPPSPHDGAQRAVTPPDAQRDSAPDPGRDTDQRDLQLVRAIRDADPAARAAAWSTLLEAYEDRLYGVCLRMVRNPDTARDLTQDAFVKVIQGLDSYDGRARLSTWMIRVTMNVCLSHLRKQKLRRHASLDAPTRAAADRPWSLGASLEQSTEPAADSPVERSQMRRRIEEGLAQLEEDHRAVLVLRDIRGLDYREIAEVLAVPIGTVKSRLFRARAALRDELEKQAGDNPGTGTIGSEDE